MVVNSVDNGWLVNTIEHDQELTNRHSDQEIMDWLVNSVDLTDK